MPSGMIAPSPIVISSKGYYFDDLLILFQALRAECRRPGPDTDLADKAHAAYEKAGLPRSLRKSFAHELDFKAWGTEVRGGLGRAGAPVKARVALAHVIDEVLSLGFVTRKVVEMLCGHIAFAFGL